MSPYRFIYLPLEGYKERYTMQWSAPKTGWLERRWIEAGVDYHRVDPQLGEEPGTIRSGQVVDALARSKYTFAQITRLLELANEGKIDSDTVIYIDDFWTPGLEALPYMFQQIGISPRIYGFLHAQSVDEFDFTYPMRDWMRPIEQGYGKFLSGIFVCCHTLRDLVVEGGIAPRNKVHVTGHPFASDEVAERMPKRDEDFDFLSNKKNNIVFSSRWDDEKNPQFFLDVVDRLFSRRENVTATVCTSAPVLRSNNPANLSALRAAIDKWDGRLKLLEGCTKEEYYQVLLDSKIQINTADQDFVAITALEASVAGCWPVYPNFRSFPETFRRDKKMLTEHKDAVSYVALIDFVLNAEHLFSRDEYIKRLWIHERFDTSWLRMLDIMQVSHMPGMSAGDYRHALQDPFIY